LYSTCLKQQPKPQKYATPWRSPFPMITRIKVSEFLILSYELHYLEATVTIWGISIRLPRRSGVSTHDAHFHRPAPGFEPSGNHLPVISQTLWFHKVWFFVIDDIGIPYMHAMYSRWDGISIFTIFAHLGLC
jgi:hypothetical protein